MKTNVYSIYDSAAKAFTQPFFMQNDGLAVRAFTDNVNSDTANNISEHPDQFTLFKVGEWDDTNALLISLDTKESLGTGTMFKTTSPQVSKLEILIETLATKIQQMEK